MELPAGAPARIVGTQIYGLTAQSLGRGPVSASGIAYLKTDPAISNKHPWE